MCKHRTRINPNDKRFLQDLRIKAYDCSECEQIEAKVQKLLAQSNEASHDDDEAKE